MILRSWTKDGYFEELVAKSGEERIGAVVDNGLTANHLNLNDDKDLYLFNNFVAKKAAYSRTMKEGTKWATLCLPFDVSLDGQNFRAFHLLSTTEDGESNPGWYACCHHDERGGDQAPVLYRQFVNNK